MLMYRTPNPFDGDGWLYELKLDGARCLAYAGSRGTELIDKRGKNNSEIYPEVQLSQNARANVILDGELVVLTNGLPDFYALMARARMKSKFRISIGVKTTPVSFVAFDILYADGQNLCSLPLIRRKEILNTYVTESGALSISRYVEKQGINLYNAAVAKNLEGVIAKRIDSIYRPGKRVRSWLKFVNPAFPGTRRIEE